MGRSPPVTKPKGFRPVGAIPKRQPASRAAVPMINSVRLSAGWTTPRSKSPASALAAIRPSNAIAKSSHPARRD
jgi:hypothetical protein